MHFQLLLLFQAYCKLISRVDTIKREAEVRLKPIVFRKSEQEAADLYKNRVIMNQQ